MNGKEIFEESYYRFSHGVPVLSRDIIENTADNVLSYSNIDSLPIPIESIMENGFRLVFDFQNLQPDGEILGETIFAPGYRDVFHAENFSIIQESISVNKGTILIDESLVDMEARYRFTLAHELGHWILHQRFYGLSADRARACRSFRRQSIVASHKSVRSPIQWTEWQADTFAASILMPREAVRRTVKQFLDNNSLSCRKLIDFEDYRSRTLYSYLIDDVSIEYGVSKEAARIRLNKLFRVSYPN